MKYQVRYEATYYVEAENKFNALGLAMEQHAEIPDGGWDVVRDPYESPLSSLADGTYSVLDGTAYLTTRQTGYWVGITPVQALSDVPKDAFLGVWTDSAGERFYDNTRHVEALNEALVLADYYGQKAIWDCANNVEIPVN